MRSCPEADTSGQINDAPRHDYSDSPLTAPDESSRTRTQQPAGTRSRADRSGAGSGSAMPVAAHLIVRRCNAGTP